MNWVIAEHQQSRGGGKQGSNVALQETGIIEPEILHLKGPLEATGPNSCSREIQPDLVAHSCGSTVSEDELNLWKDGSFQAGSSLLLNSTKAGKTEKRQHIKTKTRYASSQEGRRRENP